MKNDKKNFNSNSPKSEKKQSWVFLGLIFFTAAGLLLWKALEEQKSNSHRSGVNPRAETDLVNRHLKSTYSSMKDQELAAQVENFKSAPRLNETRAESSYEASSLSLEFQPDPRLKNLPEMMGRASKPVEENPGDVKALIQEQLYKDQKWQEYDQAYREAYAEQFIENARRGGWAIKLNENFEVISAKPIRKNQNQPLFHSPGQTPQ